MFMLLLIRCNIINESHYAEFSVRSFFRKSGYYLILRCYLIEFS